MRYILAFIVAPIVVIALVLVMVELVRYQPSVQHQDEGIPIVEVELAEEPVVIPDVTPEPQDITSKPVASLPPMPSIDIEIIDVPIKHELPQRLNRDNPDIRQVSASQVVVGQDKGVLAQQRLQPLYRVEPKYPGKAKRLAIEGWVELLFDVNPLGEVENIRTAGSEPKRIFEREAHKALAQWKFRPLVADGQNRYVKDRRVVIEFQLD